MSLKGLFRSDPTRQLEEVQKVNARERAETDVAEFHETESAKRVLTELGDIIETHPGEAARFLYLHATFGSGKTHLLKLIGLVADSESEFAHLGDTLAEQWPGFDNLAHSIDASHVDRLKPVFLNLLDRDASKEPPLPFLIFEAIGRELGYPTDPNWLLEWAWTVDMEYDGVWETITSGERGQEFDDVLEERASLRKWLYETLPSMSETTGTDLDSRDGVKASIERAEDEVEPESFDPAELVDRVETITDSLNEDGPHSELLLGLDEVALFVGDSRHRYREFEETMEALQHGPNPVVVTTGQYSLPATRESLIGEPLEDHWTHQQVPLEGADTEIIVRKRWLQKDGAGTERVSSLISSMPDLSLETYAPVGSADPDAVESYPFREYDLTLLRKVMQELITQGRATDRDYIQGRALLVLVRSLFTKFGWADAEEGELVTWDELFDLLVEETTYVPLWVQEMLENTLIPTFDGNEGAWEVRVSKALYLLNQTPAVPATPENLGRLMLADVDASVDSAVEETQSALNTLVDKRKVLTETNDKGDEVYTLVSEEQESVLSRAQTKAEQISPHQLSAWLETRLRETDDFFRSDGTLHDADIGDERLVPLRYEYSILDPVDRAPKTEYDAVRVRVLADDPETVTEQVETWQDVNDGRDGGEHILISIDVPESTLDRIRNVIGMSQVLEEETESHEELEREHRTDKRRLESSVSDLLENASVYTVHDYEGERPTVLGEVVEAQVQAVFGSTRKVLSRPLVEVDDAKELAQFFRGSGSWPLADADAVMLGVDTSTASIADTGWCRAFIDEYESKTAVDVETLLQQTRTANGDYRGTPQESIAALLITLATSNETVALKQDTDYVTDPAAIGRQVRTKGGLTSLQVRFGVDTVDPKAIRNVVSTVLGDDPEGNDPDAWVAELGSWVADNSMLVRRTFKGVSREFDVSLDALESVLSPAYSGDDITTAELVTDGVQSEAETFADARELFAAGDGGETLWDQFTAETELLEEWYPGATITSRMQTTAESGSVPTKTTVASRLADATGHRVDELSTQYRRVTGESADSTDPDEICTELTEWLRENESTVDTLLDDATATFGGVSFEELESVFEVAWTDRLIGEPELVDPVVTQQATAYEQAREILRGDPSPWAQLEARAETLRADHPESPTTKAIDSTLGAARPVSLEEVRRLLAMPVIGGDDIWTELQRVAEELRQELPNADVTDDVTGVVDADDRPTDERATELLDESEKLLARIREVRAALDDVDDGDIVLIEE
ncbi:hypothetical protein [Haloplanus aerogenes]|uniref:Uncharacterized protein n=1 Tax=Haloplanus aerogenes TaxID=660522 RepID=A0A3M0D4W9_9EURY|nr:hypothetical protein [Haloplanus aerogenes]AZH24851.1 hypothetical protein DU502_05460 [Haloplanus aerogenes]RMB13946.1 hypothetical protein ATH50_2390 [Haloplanus aerogenes]